MWCEGNPPVFSPPLRVLILNMYHSQVKFYFKNTVIFRHFHFFLQGFHLPHFPSSSVLHYLKLLAQEQSVILPLFFLAL